MAPPVHRSVGGLPARASPARTAVPGLLGAALLTLVGLHPATALEPERSITQYGHDAWAPQNGLPGEAVYEIANTPEGYIWLRTSAGLVRFDGVRFTAIDPRGPGEPSDTVRAICKSVDGDLLVRGVRQTHVYRSGAFASYLPQQALPEGVVRLIFQTRDRRLWIGADNYIYSMKAPAAPPAAAAPDAEEPALVVRNTGWASAFLEDHTGHLWIGAAHALYRYEDGSLSTFRDGAAVTALAEAPDHSLWVGTRDGLLRLAGDRLTAEGVSLDLRGKEITALLVDRDENLWVGTAASGLHRLTRGRWSSITVAEGLRDNAVVSLAEDHTGSLWVGTRSGLERFRNTKLTPVTSHEGLASDNVASILEGRDGSVYLFCDGGGLTRLEKGKATTYTVREGLASNYGGSLYEARDGSVWIGTGNGLSRLKDGRVTTYRAGGRLAHVFVPAMEEDDKGLIVGTAERGVRLHRLRGDTLVDFAPGELPATLLQEGTYVFTMYRDATGTLWLATGAGLFKVPAGAPPNPAPLPGVTFPVTSIYDDGRGSLWLAGRSPGVTRLRVADGRVTQYTTKDGLLDDTITRALTDRAGNLWLSSSRGIFSLERRELDAFAAGRLQAVRATAYDTSDGMKTSEASIPEHQPAGCRTRDGRLWFATRKGAVIVDPQTMARNELVPPVFIEEMVADGESLPWPKDVELGPGKSTWEIRYTALNLLVPERAQFKYRLDGYDTDWVEAGSRRSAYYTNLPPRKYRFRVIASNDDGVWNETGATLALRVRPSLTETPWFRSLGGLGLVLLALAAHRLRTRRLRSREQALVRVVDERTRDLQGEVAERTLKETALRRERAMLDAVLDHIPDNIYFKDRESRFTRVNRALVAWLGLSDPSQVLGRTDSDFFSAEHARDARADEDAIVRTGQFVAGKEEKETWPDGSTTWVLTTKIPLRDEAGAIVGTMGISRDITTRKRMEEELRRYKEHLEEQVLERTSELRAAEERYRTIFENAAEGIFRWAPPGRFIVANPAMARILGYDSPQALIAASRREGSDQPHALRLDRLLEGNDGKEKMLTEARRGDGRRIWLSLTARAVRDVAGELRYYEGTAEDVTEWKRAEEAEGLLRKALKKSARDWETTFDALDASILILDGAGRVVRLNLAAAQAAGRVFGEALGLPVAQLREGEPWARCGVAAREVLRTGAAVHAQTSDPVGGKTWDLAAFLSPDSESGDERVIVVARDVSPMVELQSSLRRSETMSAMGMLVAGVAHEVRNPLFAISANLDAFEAKMGKSAGFDPLISRLRAEVGRLATVMEGLLDYGKVSQLDLALGQVGAVVADSVEACLGLATARGVTLTTDLAPDLPAVLMDRKRMAQVFQNLLQNSIQHTPAGGTVTVRSAPVDRDEKGRGRLTVVVEDSGRGIAPEMTHRVFEPFFSQRRGGTGLGLAIVRRIVEDHGGTVSAGNRPEGGARMTVRLPC